MEFFPTGTVFDFMRLRALNMWISGLSFLAAILFIFVWPGPRLGLDFRGGTEVELLFKEKVSAGEVRSALAATPYSDADVISTVPERGYLIRVSSSSALTRADRDKIRARLLPGIGNVGIRQTKFSPGGEKISIRAWGDVDPADIEAALKEAGARVRNVVRFGNSEQHRYEASLTGVADEVTAALRAKFGEKLPAEPQRIEWVGPKAGAQLRDAAVESLLFAILFIMLYVAVRFDLRFAPGGVLAMVHDTIITFGIMVLLGREISLTTVAALLTIVGYSINDTVVVYDRIRENIQKYRGKSLIEVINISTSQMLSRTILTSGTTVLSISAFFIWGTPLIKDFALALVIGIAIGTYSSIYVAAPFTEWIDRTFFKKSMGTRSDARQPVTA